MTEDKTAITVAETRAAAEQAEAEAAEVEALAAAARAHAVQLRRQTEGIEAGQVSVDESVEGETQGTPTQNPLDDTSPGDAMDDAVTDSDSDSDSDEDATCDVPAPLTTTWYRHWRRFRLSTVAVGLAILLTLALLAGSGYIVWQHRTASQQRQRATEFAAAARQGVVNLTSLDFNDAKRGVQRVLDNSTGTFRADFQKTADDFVKVVEESKVVEQGSVKAAAVDRNSMTKDSAVVLLAATAEVTNAAGAKQDPRRYRLIVTIARDGDQLKMSKVEFVP